MKIKIYISLLSILSLSLYAEDKIIYSKPVQDTISQGTIKYFIEGKEGANSKANLKTEDGLFYNNHYLAVFDGATDKSGKVYQGRKGGRVARDIIYDVFDNLPKGLPPSEVISTINKSYQEFYSQNPSLDFEKNPLFRPTSTLIWFDFTTNTLASIGDAKARIDGKSYGETEKLVDELNSELRSLTISKIGLENEQIQENDLGREYILPLLKKQSDFQNNPKAPEVFQYWAIDGFNIPDDKISTWKFNETPKTIELSSDGYFYPEDSTIESYERKVFSVIKEDPMMVKKYKSTKGVGEGNVSFDDRAVLIFTKS